jgi:hypothetical protein
MPDKISEPKAGDENGQKKGQDASNPSMEQF